MFFVNPGVDTCFVIKAVVELLTIKTFENLTVVERLGCSNDVLSHLRLVRQ